MRGRAALTVVLVAALPGVLLSACLAAGPASEPTEELPPAWPDGCHEGGVLG